MGLEKFINVNQTEEYFNSPYGKPSRLDERLWIPPMGDSRVRLLPQPVENSVPYLVVQRHSYNYQDQILWAICPKTIGQKCPICDVAWTFYYATPETYGSKAAYLNNLGAGLRPITRFYFNVLIVSDPENPENEGEVKVLSMGRKLWNIVQQGWKDIGLAIFDPENGYDLIIRKRQMGQFPDYTTSSFARQASNVGKIEDLLERAYVLTDLITVYSDSELIEMFSVIPEFREFYEGKSETPTPKVVKGKMPEIKVPAEVETEPEDVGTFLPGVDSSEVAEPTSESETKGQESDTTLDVSDIDDILSNLDV